MQALKMPVMEILSIEQLKFYLNQIIFCIKKIKQKFYFPLDNF